MCRLRNIAMRDYQESVTTGQTHGRTDIRRDRRRTKLSLCAARSNFKVKVSRSNSLVPIERSLHKECTYET